MATTRSIHHTYQAALACEVCEDYAEVNWYCMNCAGRLCSACKTNHSKAMPIFKNHNIIPLVDALRQKSEEEECTLHPSYTYSLHCQSCQKLVCNKCVSGQEHRGHEFGEIKDAMLNVRHEIEEYIKTLKNKFMVDCQVYEAEIVEEKDHCHAGYDSVESQVNDRRGELKTEIDRVCDNLLLEIRNHKKRHIANLDQIMKKVKDRIKDLDSLIAKSERVLTDTNSEMNLFNKEKLRISNLNLEIPSLHIPKFLRGKTDSQNIGRQIGKLEVMKHQIQDLANDQTKPEAEVMVVSREKKMHVENVVAISERESLIRSSNQRELALVNLSGQIMKIINTEFNITDFAVLSQNDIIITDYGGRKVRRISDSGEVTVSFSTAPNYPSGICLANKGQNVVICINSKDWTSGSLVTYSLDGKVLNTMQYTNQRVGGYTQQRVTQNAWGDFCIAHRGQHAVYGIDNKGSLRFTYDKSNAKTKENFAPWAISCDRSNRLLITDVNCIHILDECGNFIKFIMTEKVGILSARELSIAKDGKVWIGQSKNGLSIVKYNL